MVNKAKRSHPLQSLFDSTFGHLLHLLLLPWSCLLQLTGMLHTVAFCTRAAGGASLLGQAPSVKVAKVAKAACRRPSHRIMLSALVNIRNALCMVQRQQPCNKVPICSCIACASSGERVYILQRLAAKGAIFPGGTGGGR